MPRSYHRPAAPSRRGLRVDRYGATAMSLPKICRRVMTSWTLLRRGDDVVLAEETRARARGWQVWGEWSELAWAEAVDRWEGSALALTRSASVAAALVGSGPGR